MAEWNLECLLCGHKGADLVKMQEHGMNDHGITREELGRVTREPKELTAAKYVWTLPDGRQWLKAVKAPDFISEVQAIAEGKIKCGCGNEDWQQFVFVGSDAKHLVAGCKKCGKAQMLKEGGVWQATTN